MCRIESSTKGRLSARSERNRSECRTHHTLGSWSRGSGDARPGSDVSCLVGVIWIGVVLHRVGHSFIERTLAPTRETRNRRHQASRCSRHRFRGVERRGVVGGRVHGDCTGIGPDGRPSDSIGVHDCRAVAAGPGIGRELEAGAVDRCLRSVVGVSASIPEREVVRSVLTRGREAPDRRDYRDSRRISDVKTVNRRGGLFPPPLESWVPGITPGRPVRAR
jgi:hypothetical protein